MTYQTSVGRPRPWATVGSPARPRVAPVGVPELPPPAPFRQHQAPAAVPELPPHQWPSWLGGPVPLSTPEPGPGRRSGRIRWVLEWLVVLAIAVLLAVGVRMYAAQMFFIPSGSMEPTLQVGDRIVVDKLSYHLHSVHRGDIVVFRRPPLERAAYTDLVKRVIGLPGDTVASVGGRITVDGKPLAEPWLPVPPPPSLPSPLTAPYSLNHPFTVPAGEYFVMGDNRTDSEDSRYFGPIPGNLIVGKMAFKAWPLGADAWSVLLAVAAVLLLVLCLAVFRSPARRHPDGRTRRRGPPVAAVPPV